MDFLFKEKYGAADLIEIVRILRAPGGCPWDREQTHASIRMNLIEETYEAAEAIDARDPAMLEEIELHFGGRPRHVLQYRYERQRIWGVTASILFNLRERLAPAPHGRT